MLVIALSYSHCLILEMLILHNVSLDIVTDIVSQDVAATLKVLYAMFKKHKGKWERTSLEEEELSRGNTNMGGWSGSLTKGGIDCSFSCCFASFFQCDWNVVRQILINHNLDTGLISCLAYGNIVSYSCQVNSSKHLVIWGYGGSCKSKLIFA